MQTYHGQQQSSPDRTSRSLATRPKVRGGRVGDGVPREASFSHPLTAVPTRSLELPSSPPR